MPKPRHLPKVKSGVVQQEFTSSVTCNELSPVWHELWNLRVGNPKPITRDELEIPLGSSYPKETVLGCLRTFRNEDLIQCIKDDIVIINPFKESDFEMFGLTAKGTHLGANYKC